MSWDDLDLVGEGEDAFVDGLHELAGVASGEVGATYRAGKERVSGNEEGLVREV